jgi:NDP-sugar pyrophosphorylase family protein
MRAMILCAGYGTRLGDLTRDIPKPMLDLQGKPLLEYIILNLSKHGFNQIAINLHFMPETIQSYFGDGSRFGVELVYSYEEKILGTAGGIKKMESFLNRDDVFLVHYGDIFTNQDFSTMLKFHLDKLASATLLLHQRSKSNSIVVINNEGRITKFLERPDDITRKTVTSPWVNSGVALCSPKIFNHIPSGEVSDLPKDVFPNLVSDGQLYGFPLSGYRFAIDSPERLAEARLAANNILTGN